MHKKHILTVNCRLNVCYYYLQLLILLQNINFIIYVMIL